MGETDKTEESPSKRKENPAEEVADKTDDSKKQKIEEPAAEEKKVESVAESDPAPVVAAENRKISFCLRLKPFYNILLCDLMRETMSRINFFGQRIMNRVTQLGFSLAE